MSVGEGGGSEQWMRVRSDWGMPRVARNDQLNFVRLLRQALVNDIIVEVDFDPGEPYRFGLSGAN